MGMKFLFVQEMRLSVENVTSRARAMGQSTFVIFFFTVALFLHFISLKTFLPGKRFFARVMNKKRFLYFSKETHSLVDKIN